MGSILVYRGQQKGQWFAVHKYRHGRHHYHPNMRKVVLPFRGWYGEQITRQEWAFIGRTPFEAFYRCQRAFAPTPPKGDSHE